MARTLYDKIYASRLIRTEDDGTSLLYVDRHLVHEVTSPQAFEGLRTSGRRVRRPLDTFAVADHNVPTLNRAAGIADPESRLQVETLAANAAQFGVVYYPLDDVRQGIVHVTGPEQGITLPGNIIVCGDSHTSTHGAFGALAHGIGTSEVEHVLATGTLLQKKAKNFRINVEGELPAGVTAKDIVLTIIGTVGTAGATGHVIEYAGSAMRALSPEGRMTVCNMSIEAGAKAGLIAPDDVIFDYLRGRAHVPADFEAAVAHWRTLFSDPDAVFDREITLRAEDIAPSVTWGTTPDQVLPITGHVPDPAAEPDPSRRAAAERALAYMDLTPGTPLSAVAISRVFIGSCTNGRIEDLRAAAAVARGRRVAAGVQAMVVPGSGLVKAQAEREGLDRVFVEAGFEWREPGCSMCLAMNADRLEPGERCASTSNRNFEGRQGRGGRTHLMSPAMAAAAALTGRLTDVRNPEALHATV